MWTFLPRPGCSVFRFFSGSYIRSSRRAGTNANPCRPGSRAGLIGVSLPDLSARSWQWHSETGSSPLSITSGFLALILPCTVGCSSAQCWRSDTWCRPLRHQQKPRLEFMLSIVVVNWNTRLLLGACLQSVFDTVRTSPLEVWVVDNG